MSNTIPVFFVIDDGYVKILHVALKSLIMNASKKYDYNIHILCSGLTEENKKSFMTFESDNFKIFIEDVSKEAMEHAGLMERNYHGDTNKNGCATYYRAFIPARFTQYDKALYLDSDIVIRGDISELYHVDMGDNIIAAIPDGPVARIPAFQKYVENFIGVEKHHYFNAGVVVMNCKLLREMDFEKKFFDLLTKCKLEVDHDQGVLNYLVRGKVVYMPENWNKMVLTGETIPVGEVKLVHYNLTGKPWINDGVAYSDLFWEYAEGTMFYAEIVAGKAKVTANDAEGAQTNLMKMIASCENLSKGMSLAEIESAEGA